MTLQVPTSVSSIAFLLLVYYETLGSFLRELLLDGRFLLEVEISSAMLPPFTLSLS